MNISASSPAGITAPTHSYNRAAVASANAGLLLAAEGYSGTTASVPAVGSSFNPAAAANRSASGLLGYLGLSATAGAPAAPAKGSFFDPAAAAEGSASQLLGYEGFPVVSNAVTAFGQASTSADTTASDYGRGQYASVSALLGSTVVGSQHAVSAFGSGMLQLIA